MSLLESGEQHYTKAINNTICAPPPPPALPPHTGVHSLWHHSEALHSSCVCSASVCFGDQELLCFHFVQVETDSVSPFCISATLLSKMQHQPMAFLLVGLGLVCLLLVGLGLVCLWLVGLGLVCLWLMHLLWHVSAQSQMKCNICRWHDC